MTLNQKELLVNLEKLQQMYLKVKYFFLNIENKDE
jgi:hypothetical protein